MTKLGHHRSETLSRFRTTVFEIPATLHRALASSQKPLLQIMLAWRESCLLGDADPWCCQLLELKVSCHARSPQPKDSRTLL